MATEHIKIFSGSSILIKGLEVRLNDDNINYIVKDRVESARLGGFGEHRTAIDLLVLDSDLEKAQPIVDAYNKEINA